MNRTAKVTFPNPPPTLAIADHAVLLYTARLGDTLPVDGRKILFSQVEGEIDRGQWQWPMARSRSLRSR